MKSSQSFARRELRRPKWRWKAAGSGWRESPPAPSRRAQARKTDQLRSKLSTIFARSVADELLGHIRLGQVVHGRERFSNISRLRPGGRRGADHRGIYAARIL